MEKLSKTTWVGVLIAIILFSLSMLAMTPNDPLPSWNEGPAKKAILDFVNTTTDKQSSQYIPPEERIATFDQDGTLWVEQPIYTQVIFAFDRIVALAAQHPEWKNQEPFKSLIAKNKAAIAKFTLKDLEKIVMVTHTGMTVETFQALVKNWIEHAKNPRWNRPYTDLIYQPMLEVMNLFRTNGYQTYIVTGGGQDFVRVYANNVYGVPPEKVIGSAIDTKYSYDKQGNGELIKVPKLLLNNNMSGKPEDIYLFIGQHSKAAFGNSTGDQQMLEYTEASKGAHLMMLVHHDDAKREYAYGPQSKIGTFSDALMAEATKRGWHVISMKNDWKVIFPFEMKQATAQ
jgi:phosphoglycolate phosphatase-like HAD superfamily hydrolase